MTKSISLDTSDFQRACTAYFRYHKRAGGIAGELADQPGRDDSHLLITDKANYVVLANGYRTLGVFSVGEDDALRRVDREDWPKRKGKSPVVGPRIKNVNFTKPGLKAGDVTVEMNNKMSNRRWLGINTLNSGTRA